MKELGKSALKNALFQNSLSVKFVFSQAFFLKRLRQRGKRKLAGQVLPSEARVIPRCKLAGQFWWGEILPSSKAWQYFFGSMFCLFPFFWEKGFGSLGSEV
ncbi:MAG TPA: hypothetical protein HA227_02850 [Candidatus Diapherotrites archaeon]|uniref:Uncharacterized protein n=1 Tax=Candidatus Iainarchaeum sp. TaxID=3101447 RepID=A0A7J4KTL8_9ARCH|nr:hypothetical protein [Candidatus Diapherotrites archaeon]